MSNAKTKTSKNNNPCGKGGFQKGHEKIGGRQKGTPHKISALLKDQLVSAMSLAGEVLAESIDGKTKRQIYPYLQRADGDWGLAYLTWFALTHPEHFMQHASKLLPYQFHHSGNTDVEHQHEHEYIVKLLGGKDLSQLSMAELSSLYAEAIKPPPPNQLKLISANGDGR
jgi:hypothetical protein